MCLYLENNEVNAKIAEKDIKCYKVIKRLDDGSYETPYRNYPIEIGETYESRLILDEGYNFPKIEIGLHSFKSLKFCKKNIATLKFLIPFNENEYFIAECIIPKGGEYYEGKFNVFPNCYASNKIKYVKIIDNN